MKLLSSLAQTLLITPSCKYKNFFQRAEMLEKSPNIGRVVPELNLKSVRELIEGNYRIIYRVVSKEEVHILTIHHSAKRLRKSRLKR